MAYAKMKRILVEPSMSQKLADFLAKERIALAAVTDGHCEVRVFRCDDRKACNLETIYSGGWIGCEKARALAKRLSIPVRQMGEMLDFLDVKIRDCGLGCFK